MIAELHPAVVATIREIVPEFLLDRRGCRLVRRCHRRVLGETDVPADVGITVKEKEV